MNAISKGQQPLKIDIWTDFLCPFCYLTTLRVQRLAQIIPVEITARAFMLRPHDAPPLPEDFRGIVEAEYERIGYDIAAEFDLQIAPGPVGLRTYAAHLAGKLAQNEGLGFEFHQAVMRAYWLEGLSIDDADVLMRIGISVGVKRSAVANDAMMACAEAALRADKEAALAYAGRSAPLLVFGQRIILRGAVSFDTMLKAATDATCTNPAEKASCVKLPDWPGYSFQSSGHDSAKPYTSSMG